MRLRLLNLYFKGEDIMSKLKGACLLGIGFCIGVNVGIRLMKGGVK